MLLSRRISRFPRIHFISRPHQKSFRVLCLNTPLEGAFPAGCTDDLPAGQSLARSTADQQTWLRQQVPRLLLCNATVKSGAGAGASATALAAAAAALRPKTELVDNAVAVLQRQCAQFNASYMMVKAYFTHAADKLRAGVEKAISTIVDSADQYSPRTHFSIPAHSFQMSS